MKFNQAMPGKVIRQYWRKNGSAVELAACCDCGLVHTMQYTPRKRYIAIRAWRNEEVTKQLRKRHGNKARRRR